MKIMIDTQKDTHDDIKKILNILTHILDRKDSFTEKSPERFPETDSTSMMSMFADPEVKKVTEPQDRAPDFSSFLNLTRKEEEKKGQSEIQYF